MHPERSRCRRTFWHLGTKHIPATHLPYPAKHLEDGRVRGRGPRASHPPRGRAAPSTLPRPGGMAVQGHSYLPILIGPSKGRSKSE
ncbi:hypothetical protein C8Q80DRAFT_1138958 [Daedaleopsis nitida]|nr:hypothetical protein C8Q80DRAFT_1138958 [Daedaleopsis nitida]